MRQFQITVDGRSYRVTVEPMADGDVKAPQAIVEPSSPAKTPAQPNRQAPTSGGDPIKAPMAGKVLSIKVSVGEAVKKGQVIGILEVMKMETEITAPKDGRITAILVEAGAAIETGAPIATLEA